MYILSFYFCMLVIIKPCLDCLYILYLWSHHDFFRVKFLIQFDIRAPTIMVVYISMDFYPRITMFLYKDYTNFVFILIVMRFNKKAYFVEKSSE